MKGSLCLQVVWFVLRRPTTKSWSVAGKTKSTIPKSFNTWVVICIARPPFFQTAFFTLNKCKASTARQTKRLLKTVVHVLNSQGKVAIANRISF